VEEPYVNWDLAANYSMSFQSTRHRVAGWWPTQGVAWEKFGDIISEHVGAGRLVICSNTDSPDHPEYHITQGHTHPSSSSPFIWGELRYITTPAWSITCKEHLAVKAAAAERQARQKAAEEQQRTSQLILVTDRVLGAAQGGAATVAAMAAATGFPKNEVQAAVHRFVADGRLSYDGRRFMGGHRWRPASTTTASLLSCGFGARLRPRNHA
jgi:hypothetical protein